MAKIKPFKAIRPRADLVHRVASLPYDVLSVREARKIIEINPYSFLRVEKSEAEFAEEVSVHDRRVYERARENLDRMIKDGILIQDPKPCLYIYRQIMEGRSQTGLVACFSIDDYLNGLIKRHELTRADKELERVYHIDLCDANTGPVFLVYPVCEDIDRLVKGWASSNPPLYDFTSEDGVRHSVWVIDDDKVIDKIVELFKGVSSIYIADGHHRCAAGVKVGLERRRSKPNYTGEEGFNYFLGVVFPHTDVYIMEYNRLVRDLNGLSEDEFLSRVKENFYVEDLGGGSTYRPEGEHIFGMYFKGRWFKLIPKPGTFDDNDPVGRLDANILQENLLRPILGIEDPRTDKRIDFVGGIKGLGELCRRVDSGEMAVAFSLYPTTIESIMAVSDAGKVMPPKSTWFEPKLRSGLFVHRLTG